MCVCVCVCGGGGGGGIQFAVVWVVSNTYDCSLCYFRRWLKVCEGEMLYYRPEDNEVHKLLFL